MHTHLKTFLFLLGLVFSLVALADAQSVNGTTGNFPFPQNRDNPFGFHSSIYNNSDILTAYNKWYADCVTSSGAGGFLRVQRPHEPGLLPNSTVSEGIGYGMVIAVYMNDQNLFDKLWEYEQKYLDGSGLMNWYIDSSGTVQGSGGATDADEDMAWGLLMASKQWGSSTTLGKTYLSLAVTQINAIYGHELNGGVPDGGDGFTPINPSYFAPAYYREFANASGQAGWTTVASSCYTVLNANLAQGYGNATNGLDSAWCTNAGVSTATNNAPWDYQYDACRSPFRITEDYLWFGNSSSQSYATKTSDFFSAIGAVSIVDGYFLNGGPDPQYQKGSNVGLQSAAFVGPAGVGGMVSRNYQQYMDETYADLTGSWLTVGGTYYDESWTVMSLLMLSDNFLDYNLYNLSGTDTPTRSTTPTNTATGTATATVTNTPTATGTLATSTPTPTATAIYVNCAGPQYVSASSGITWLADQAYAAGSWGYTTGSSYSSAGPISGTLDQTLYETERAAGGVTYLFTLPDRVYNVTLKYAETYYSGTGQRVFNVILNGTTVIPNLDIYSAVGGKNIAYDRTFPVTVTSGTLELDETASVQIATIMAIGIVPVVAPTDTPTLTPTATITATHTLTPTLTRTSTPTFSPTSTPTRTPTLTVTASPTLTPTFSSTATSSLTSSFTPSRTPTLTATSSPTFSPTYSPTATPSLTASRTPSRTPTVTTSFTATSSATRTPSSTPTLSTTATPSQTSTKTGTLTPIPTNSPTATASASPSSTPTKTPTLTATSSPTSSSTYSPTVTPSLTASRTPSRTPTATTSFTATSSATSTPSFTATLSTTATPSQTLTNTGTLTPVPSNTPTATPTASPSATPSPSVTLTPTTTGSTPPTLTPTATSQIPILIGGLPLLYPNPAKGETLSLLLPITSPTDGKIMIFTTAFRKVLIQPFTQNQPEEVITIELKDNWGKPLADGLYYLIIATLQDRWTLKFLVLR